MGPCAALPQSATFYPRHDRKILATKSSTPKPFYVRATALDDLTALNQLGYAWP